MTAIVAISLVQLCGGTFETGFVLAFLLDQAIIWFLPARHARAQHFTLDPEGIHIESSTGELTTISFAEISDFEIRGRSPHEFLVMRLKGQQWIIPRTAFDTPMHFNLFINEFLLGMTRDPRGAVQLAELQGKARQNARLFGHRPRFSMISAAFLLLCFLIQELALYLWDLDLVFTFANSAPLVLIGGEYYRLLTGALLHANILHITLNLMGLLSIGYILESIAGWRWLFALLIFSTLGASVASVFHQHIFSIGISGAVFGYLGALFWLHLRFDPLPIGMQLSKRWWVTVLLLNALLPLLQPSIDVAAHVGGFICGLLIAALTLRSNDLIRRGQPPRVANAIYLIAFIIVSVLSVQCLTHILQVGWQISPAAIDSKWF